MLTDSEIREMRSLNRSISKGHVQGMAIIRTNLDLIESIARFDKASADLIKTTNKLTRIILGLTILAVLLSFCSFIASAWSPLVWWVSNGFRLW